ncbi:hypothetical protein ABIB40_002226 [Pedobacter sp. UYP30]|uniref:hypothetical protein n=1 Tax=Pedobacter sp. UYP30 TaxID=1756400 RepID=UPI003399A608
MEAPESFGRTATYRVTLANHLRLLKNLLFFIGGFLLTLVYFYLTNYKDFKILAIIMSIMTICWCVPSLILHYNYYEQAKDLTIIEHEEFFEVFKHQQPEIRIEKKDTIVIDLYIGTNMMLYNSNFGKFPTGEYCYAIIKTPTDTIILNNLIYPDVKYLPQRFPEVKASYHKTGFAKI